MRLDHVNIHARDQEAVRDFLIRLLGLKVGWRPNFDEPGYWLYLAGDDSPPARNANPDASFPVAARAVIHTWPRSSPPGAGWVDHLAFGLYDDPDQKRSELAQLGFPVRETRLPDSTIVQFFVTGPEGIKIELQCRGPARVTKS